MLDHKDCVPRLNTSMVERAGAPLYPSGLLRNAPVKEPQACPPGGMVDAADLKSAVGNDVPVRVRRWAVDRIKFCRFFVKEIGVIALTVISRNVG